MAKVDVTKIEGYAEMSADDKLKALENYEFEVPKADDGAEVKRLKDALSKSNSEAASYKRQLHEKMTADEQKEAERAEHEAAVQEELKTYRMKDAISTYEKAYLAAGYSADLAASTAKAQAEGDLETVLANQKAFLETKQKELEDAALKKQPSLSVGNPPNGKSEHDARIANIRRYAGL